MYSYTEAGSKPLTWDQNERGIISFTSDPFDDIVILEFWEWSIDTQTFLRLARAEYVFVSLFLALVIAKFFPAIHSQIVSKAASSLEYQSLYWGSAVVANVFTYGLVLLAGRGMSTYLQCEFDPTSNTTRSSIDLDKCMESFCTLSIMQLVVYFILFAGALIASLRSPRGTNIPIPTGMGKVFINISFCCSCFCCCVWCSPRYRAKTLQVLIMFSFMSFIYHSIMDVISIGFMLLIEDIRVIIITLAFLYISVILFVVIFVSFLMTNNHLYKRSLIKCLGGSLMLVIAFSAVMLLLVIYMIIIFSLNLTGIIGIVTGLVPSVALSAVSWYIKKKLPKEITANPSATSAEAECDYSESAVNDGGTEMKND